MGEFYLNFHWMPRGLGALANLIILDETNVEMSRGWECWANLFVLDKTNILVLFSFLFCGCISYMLALYWTANLIHFYIGGYDVLLLGFLLFHSIRTCFHSN